MGEGVNRNIESELLAVVRADAFAFVAGIIGTEGAAKAIFAHYRDKVAFIKQAFKLNVASFVQAANTIDFVEGTIDDMVVGNRLHPLSRKDAAKLAAPGHRKIRIRAAARAEEKSPMTEVLLQILDLGGGQDEIIVAVHKEKWSFEEIGVREANLSFFLDFEGRCARNQFHEILADPAAVISIIGAIPHAAHEEGGLLVIRRLGPRSQRNRKHQDERKCARRNRIHVTHMAISLSTQTRPHRLRRNHSLPRQPTTSARIQPLTPIGWRHLL